LINEYSQNGEARMREFDLLNSPIEGTNLIEASAGTGKTFTIAALYLRFILEKELSPEQILVVTFTEAATKELRDRIRKKLREAVEAFTGVDSQNRLLSGLISKSGDPQGALRRLTQALRDFDRAAIFTIHGFCQRILHENAFESGSIFDTELVTDQEDLKREIIEDFWRIHFYQAPQEVVSYALAEGFSPGTFLSLLSRNVLIPDIKVIPLAAPPSMEAITKSLDELKRGVDGLAELWAAAKTEVQSKLRDPGLNATTYGNSSKIDPSSGMTLRNVKIGSLTADMEEFLASRDIAPPLPRFNGFFLFTSGRLAKATKKNCAPPGHAFFDNCEVVGQKAERVKAALDEYLLNLKIEALHYLNRELPARKRRQNIQHFDDLLLRLKTGLEQAGGVELASAVRDKYQAALIDEFQDTDSVQYAIFHSIFREAHRPLFLIGDPKQAIYSFRGADIFTYMEAARRADNIYTLAVNWRSEPDLVRAVNTFFETGSNQFVYPEIAFHPVSASPELVPRPLMIEDQCEAPLQLWFLGADPASGTEKLLRKPDARKLIMDVLASEVARLLDLGSRGLARIGEEAVKESDIAVLVRTNDEARMVQKALSIARVPGVLYSAEDLFDSIEAQETERLLAAIGEPREEGLIRAALATDMMGVDGEELARLMVDEAGWEEWVVKFRDYCSLWRDHGFIRMFRHLMLHEKIRTRLVSFSDGERRITNVLHLSEVLHHESVERDLGMAELIKWLSEQRDTRFRQNREHQLRLESDENAVKIITIHKSKGLEYPIVFCPFAWGGSRLRSSNAAFTFHAENDERRLTLDLGSPEREANRALAEKEALAENMRLLYVALTRAKKRCYLAWGPFNAAGTSSLAYLLHYRGQGGPVNNVVEETEAAFKLLNGDTILERMREIEKRSDGCISVRALPLQKAARHAARTTDGPPLSCRSFKGPIDRSWRISSFSSLVSGAMQGAELPDRDEPIAPARGSDSATGEDTESAAAATDPASSIFAFPKGTKSGLLLHDILEHLDFTACDPRVLDSLVTQKLEEYGFAPAWEQTVSQMVRNVLAAPFFPFVPGKPVGPLEESRDTYTLSCIPNEDRLNELEFYYPVESLTREALRSAFDRCGNLGNDDSPERDRDGENVHFPEDLPGGWPDDLGRLSFSRVRGFMKGFMDLVFRFRNRFYLVDWKSNHLGNEAFHYRRKALAAVMEEDYYTLQYHLYTVALDRYLRVRLAGYSYREHFGGIYYVFLRGVDPRVGPEYGVFRARPREELIRGLSDLFFSTGQP
jgi:exodeoxyribonuclease V beta subunit